jgi:hypothetical protein
VPALAVAATPNAAKTASVSEMRLNDIPVVRRARLPGFV